MRSMRLLVLVAAFAAGIGVARADIAMQFFPNQEINSCHGGTAGQPAWVLPQNLLVGGGQPTSGYTWTVTPGSTLPTGIALDSLTGVVHISGSNATLPAAGFYPNAIPITVSDHIQTISTTIGLRVQGGVCGAPAPDFAVVSGALPILARPNVPFGVTLSVYGPLDTTDAGGCCVVRPVYSWSLATGSFLPAGLVLDQSTGVIRGTPTDSSAGQQFNFGVRVLDTVTGRIANGQYSLSVCGTSAIPCPGAGPVNDDFAGATGLAPLQASTGSPPLASQVLAQVTGTNVGATKEAGEPDHAGNPGGASVWWKIQPTTTRTLVISTEGSGFDTLLAVYTGNSVDALTPVAANDDVNYPSDLTSQVSFTATAGVTYYIAVDGYNGATGNILLTVQGPATSAHDFNADGKSDILWRANTGDIAMWFMNGTALQSGASVGNIDPNWQIVKVPGSSSDFNGDGKADILWRHTNGSVAIWLMNGTTVASGAALGTIDTSWQIAGVGDFNGDGKADILWRHTSGAYAIWFMNGTSVASSAGVGSVAASWQVAAIADLDGDGKADIVLRNTTTGDVAVWLMNGATIASGAGLGVLPSAWQIVGTGDFDGNGKGDLLWRHTSGSLAMWFMNGTSIASSASPGTIDTAWNIASTGDYDGNGKADILWRSTSGDVAIWLMNGASIVSGQGLGVLPLAWSIVE